jgi:ribulose-phosphate 3-epimerase
MKALIVPAILVKTKKRLKGQLAKIRRFSNIVQIDVAKDIRSKISIEVHLMAKNPEKYVAAWKEHASLLIFHYEACRKKCPELIDLIKKNKIKAGIALNPRTSAAKIKPFLNSVDTVLVMTVTPGWQGQKFLKSQLKKIRQIRKWSRKVNIEVDGGINPENIAAAAKAGANKFSVGSFLIKSPDIKKSLNNLKKALRN